MKTQIGLGAGLVECRLLSLLRTFVGAPHDDRHHRRQGRDDDQGERGNGAELHDRRNDSERADPRRDERSLSPRFDHVLGPLELGVARLDPFDRLSILGGCPHSSRFFVESPLCLTERLGRHP